MAPINRRRFIEQSLLAAAGLATTGATSHMLSGCSLIGGSKPPPPPQSGRVLADLHVHPTMNDWLSRSPLAVRSPKRTRFAASQFNQTTANWRSCHEAGVNVMCVAHYNVFDELAPPTDPNPDAADLANVMIYVFEEALAGPLEPYARLARNHVELRDQLRVRPPHTDYRISAIHAMEGGHVLGESLEPIKELARAGVAWMTLTHFFDKGIAASANAMPFFPDDSNRPADRGLTDFGADVVRELEAHGIVVDVTHCTTRAVEDVLGVATKPMLATHASSATLSNRPYGLRDDHIIEIARRGGVVGVILYPYVTANYSDIGLADRRGSLSDSVRAIRYIVKITGSHEHVGIGSDFSGYIHGPKDMQQLSRIRSLRDLLLEEFDQDVGVVEDILVNNATRFLLKNWRSGLAA